MVTKTVNFEDINVGEHFTYDNELFIRHKNGENTEGKPFGLAWSIKYGKQYKEWAFGFQDKVTPHKG